MLKYAEIAGGFNFSNQIFCRTRLNELSRVKSAKNVHGMDEIGRVSASRKHFVQFLLLSDIRELVGLSFDILQRKYKNSIFSRTNYSSVINHNIPWI